MEVLVQGTGGQEGFRVTGERRHLGLMGGKRGLGFGLWLKLCYLNFQVIKYSNQVTK
jgi:hypothetical protein